jgi:hypothetical protein
MELVVAGVSFLFSLGSVWYASGVNRAEKDGDALRAYRFEARKRLYEQCEPLLFQLAEAAENARGRIYGIARTCRHDDLKANGDGWLREANGYFFLSTMYRLLAPVAVFQLLRRRLTTVDLNVDRRIKAQYDLSRVLYRSFKDPFKIAEQAPAHTEGDHAEQGLLWGTLDNALEAMTPPDKDGVPRLISFGQFEKLYATEGDSGALHEINYLFVGFHPTTHPVLWRMLIAQLYIYETLLDVHRSNDDELRPIADLREPEQPSLSFTVGKERPLEQRERAEVVAARRYVERRLAA